MAYKDEGLSQIKGAFYVKEHRLDSDSKSVSER